MPGAYRSDELAGSRMRVEGRCRGGQAATLAFIVARVVF